jgi:hypothetical protein
MIKMKILSGRYAGREKNFNLDYRDPMGLLADCVKRHILWEIDYSQANPEEIVLWMTADMTSRIVRALQEGRTVFFFGKQYVATEENFLEVAQQIEDDIVSSGMMVTILSDDENGLRIGISEI